MTEEQAIHYIANRLYELRKIKGISARKLSYELDKDATYISKLENGKHFPSFSTLIGICNYYKISLEDFFVKDFTKESYLIVQGIEALKNCSTERLEQLIPLIEVISNENK